MNQSCRPPLPGEGGGGGGQRVPSCGTRHTPRRGAATAQQRAGRLRICGRPVPRPACTHALCRSRCVAAQLTGHWNSRSCPCLSYLISSPFCLSAASCPPPRQAQPAACIPGLPPILAAAVMTDCRHVLTQDTEGSVQPWDVTGVGCHSSSPSLLSACSDCHCPMLTPWHASLPPQLAPWCGSKGSATCKK